MARKTKKELGGAAQRGEILYGELIVFLGALSCFSFQILPLGLLRSRGLVFVCLFFALL